MPPTPILTRSRNMSRARSRVLRREKRWKTWSTPSGDIDLYGAAGPADHRNRPTHDRLELLAGPRADGDGVDGCRRQLRQHDRIGGRRQFAVLPGVALHPGNANKGTLKRVF